MRDNAAHFYLKRSEALALTAVDMQKIDLGNALCHFALAAKECNLNITFAIGNPEIIVGTDMEYIASYLIEK